MRTLHLMIALATVQLAASPGLAIPKHVVYTGVVSSVDADLFFPFQQAGVEVGDSFSFRLSYESSVPDLAFPNDPTRATYADPVLSWSAQVGPWSVSSLGTGETSQIDIITGQVVNPDEIQIDVSGGMAQDAPAIFGSVTGFRLSSRGNPFLEDDRLPYLRGANDYPVIIRLDRGSDFPVGGLILRASLAVPEPTASALLVLGALGLSLSVASRVARRT